MTAQQGLRLLFCFFALWVCKPDPLAFAQQNAPPHLPLEVAQNEEPIDWDAPLEEEDEEFQALLEEIYQNSGQSSNQILAEQQENAQKYSFLQGYGLLLFAFYLLGVIPTLLFFHKNETVKNWPLELNFVLVFCWFLIWPVVLVVLAKQNLYNKKFKSISPAQ